AADGKLVFEGDTFSIYLGKTKLVTNRYTLKEGPFARQIEATPLDGPLKGETSRGVYAFEGDTLKIVFADPGRPPLARVPHGLAPRDAHPQPARPVTPPPGCSPARGS